ncbi:MULTISPECIES: hypothetical protein [unclassified Nocardia]|uniref:hypothetical protein n=1 Tax=unclassified Nocardia TaxID=2637762 RepID=UPI00278C6C04|nr:MULTISPECIES: hypothetical protein [unclassified Nocardia]
MVFEGETAAAFAQWSLELGELYDAWNTTNRRFAGGAQPNSPAAQDDAVLAAAFPDLSRPEGTGAGFDAVQMIDAAAQHLLGLKALVDSQTMVLAPWPVARAVGEHLAHAAWLLEPEITPQARMARRWMARVAAAHRMRLVLSERKASNARQKEAKNVREGFRKELERRFPGADITWDGLAAEPSWNVGGESYPGLGKLFKAFSTLQTTGVTGYYSTLSLYSHPNIVAVSSLSESVDQGDHRFIRYRVDTDDWGELVRSATSLTYITARAACDYLGYPNDDPLKRWLVKYRLS